MAHYMVALSEHTGLTGADLSLSLDPRKEGNFTRPNYTWYFDVTDTSIQHTSATIPAEFRHIGSATAQLQSTDEDNHYFFAVDYPIGHHNKNSASWRKVKFARVNPNEHTIQIGCDGCASPQVITDQVNHVQGRWRNIFRNTSHFRGIDHGPPVYLMAMGSDIALLYAILAFTQTINGSANLTSAVTCAGPGLLDLKYPDSVGAQLQNPVRAVSAQVYAPVGFCGRVLFQC